MSWGRGLEPTEDWGRNPFGHMTRPPSHAPGWPLSALAAHHRNASRFGKESKPQV